jgi:hypothetical protein
MELHKMLEAVLNDRIEFATMRPPGSQFAVLERRVVVTGPPELVALSHSGDLAVLAALVKLLQDPDRAWAAAVLLAALTGREADLVNAFAAHPEEWWDSAGHTAYARWTTWLGAATDKLIWDPQNQVFVQRQ